MMRDKRDEGCPATLDRSRNPQSQLWCGEWHIPPHYYPLSIDPILSQWEQNDTRPWWTYDPYQSADLFVVVRDPIERMISDYIYFCKVVNHQRKPTYCNGTNMNAFFAKRFLPAESEIADIFRDAQHFIPAYDYVMRPLQVRQIDFVLNFDRLKRDFDRLASAFALPLQITPSSKENTGTYNLTRADLNTTILGKLEERFGVDYQLLSEPVLEQPMSVPRGAAP